MEHLQRMSAFRPAPLRGFDTSAATHPRLTAAYLLPLLLVGLYAIAPDLQIEIATDNSVLDLLLREADTAVRHVRPEQSNLIAKMLSEDQMRFYAVGEYLDAFGSPKLSANVSSHQFVSFGDFKRVAGYLKLVGLHLGRRNFRYASNSKLVEWEIARNDQAIAIMSDRIASRFPEFQPVLMEVELFSLPVWLVVDRKLRPCRRVRLVFDVLAKEMSA